MDRAQRRSCAGDMCTVSAAARARACSKLLPKIIRANVCVLHLHMGLFGCLGFFLFMRLNTFVLCFSGELRRHSHKHKPAHTAHTHTKRCAVAFCVCVWFFFSISVLCSSARLRCECGQSARTAQLSGSVGISFVNGLKCADNIHGQSITLGACVCVCVISLADPGSCGLCLCARVFVPVCAFL